MCWQDRYASRYGFWRPYVTDVIYRYLDCGDLHLGFARVRCQECGHEYLLAFSCKRRHFCPSCHQKRVVEFGEWLCTQVLKLVPHRQWVLSIPKRLRIYFLNDAVIENMLSCRHSGFNVYCGPTIWPNDEKALEDLARYIIRACFSQERVTYLPAIDAMDGQAKVIYTSKDGRTSKTFQALDWLAQLATHIPNKGEQMVRYYGFYSNKSRGMRKKAGSDDQVPALVESAVSSAAFRKIGRGSSRKYIKLTPCYVPSARAL
jgi:hypothetical protein